MKPRLQVENGELAVVDTRTKPKKPVQRKEMTVALTRAVAVEF